MARGVNSATRRILSILINRGFTELIDLFKERPASLTKFVFRSAVGEFPEEYWEWVITMRFPDISQKLKQLILDVRREHELMHLFARVFAEYVVDAILRLGVELPFGLPKSGIIVDVGSGYLTGLSGGLVKYALQKIWCYISSIVALAHLL